MTPADATHPTPPCIDVRTLPPPARHPLVMGAFDALRRGQSFDLVSDHEPRPLRAQFERTRPHQFDWQPLESGPARWRVRITRVADGVAADPDGCCGGCTCGGA